MYPIRLGCPKTPTKTRDANLNCVFEKTTFLDRSLIVKRQRNRIELVTRPAHFQPADQSRHLWDGRDSCGIRHLQLLAHYSHVHPLPDHLRGLGQVWAQVQQIRKQS